MMSCMVHIVQPERTRAWVGPMLFGEIDKNEGTGETRYKVMLHPTLCEAYDRGFTCFEWMERKSIGKNELALWLHQYLLAFPKPVPVAELQQHSWQASATRSSFRHRLRAAADLLAGLGLIDKWAIDRQDRLLTKPAVK